MNVACLMRIWKWTSKIILDFNNNANKRDEHFLVKYFKVFSALKAFIYLRFLGGDGGISVNQFCEHAS